MMHINCHDSLVHQTAGYPMRSGLIPRASPQVWAMLVEMRVGCVAGFDLSVLNRYRWYPGLERMELDRRDGLTSLLQPHLCKPGDSIEGHKHLPKKHARLLCAPQCPHHICVSNFRLMRLKLGA